ncbi:hypothetical protein N0V88_007278 [Collariella sp. IMI 366227]|nr:hypothetical protein N0V88_007278 [Collariella sp. IMI 366227]
MATYTPSQLTQYFTHIHLPSRPPNRNSHQPLKFLTTLQAYHMARVPFESLSLHYSLHRLLSLSPGDLFTKIVSHGRGGYCMEVNTFFATVLRSLGFTLYSAGARVRGAEGYKVPRDHMVNIVTINNQHSQPQRYLVDTAFGSNTALHPIPLTHNHTFLNLPPSHGRLQYRRLAEHTDPSQRAWVYSIRENDAADWTEMYSFTETEFFPGDFEVMNLRTMTAPQSFFVQSVMWEIIERLGNEEERVSALEKYFGIVLSQEERRG